MKLPTVWLKFQFLYWANQPAFFFFIALKRYGVFPATQDFKPIKKGLLDNQVYNRFILPNHIENGCKYWHFSAGILVYPP